MEDTSFRVRVITFIIIIIIFLLTIYAMRSCSTDNTKKIDALKQLTQALSDYSSEVNVKIEMGTWGSTITVDVKDVDKKWLKSEECWK